MLRIQITADTSKLQVELAEMARLSSALPEAAQQALVGILDTPELLIELGGIGLDGSAAAEAGVLIFRPQLTEPARRFLAALRAGHVDADVVERTFGHASSPVVVSDAATVEPTGRVCPSPFPDAAGGVSLSSPASTTADDDAPQALPALATCGGDRC